MLVYIGDHMKYNLRAKNYWKTQEYKERVMKIETKEYSSRANTYNESLILIESFDSLSANPTKWSNTLNSSTVVDKLFECVWPFCRVGAWRVNFLFPLGGRPY